MFPVPDDKASGESPEVRHLREFSRFLLPYIQVLGTEFWGIMMTVLGGILPSLLSAIAVFVLMWAGWVALLACLLGEKSKVARPLLMLGFVACYFIISEHFWKQSRRDRSIVEQNKWDGKGQISGALLGSGLTMAGVILLRYMMQWDKVGVTGLEALKKPAVGFGPAVVVGSVTLALLALRFAVKNFFKSPNHVSFFGGGERAVAQMLRLTAIMLAFAALWWAAGWIEQEGNTVLRYFSAGTAFSTALFLWAQKWLSAPPKETHGGNLLHLAFNRLKRATPKVLAVISWLLLFLLVGVYVEWWIKQRETPGFPNFWWLPAGCVLQVGLMICFFDPKRMGLHELYRSRISRCYLGASNQDGTQPRDTPADRVEKNRSSSERLGDDLTMDKLAGVDRPLHLVCAAANDLSGDPVGTLYRGAKSAVPLCPRH